MATRGSLVSVILPVFNTGAGCIKIILQILKGDYRNVEFIIVDDGSTDDSLALLKEFVRQMKLKTTAKIKLFTENNQGVSVARNTGLEKASGQYVCFIDTDDFVSKKYLPDLVAALEKYQDYASADLQVAFSVCGMKYNRINLGGKKSDVFTKPLNPQLPDESFEDYILRLFLTDGRLYSAANKLFRRDLIEHFSVRFNPKLNFAEDTKFVLDYLKAARRVNYTKLEFVLKPHYVYNYGTPTSTVSLSSLSWSNWQKSFDHLKSWVGSRPSKKSKSLLKKIKLRWKLSHALAVARSRQSLGHKFQHSSPLLVLPALLVVKFRK